MFELGETMLVDSIEKRVSELSIKVNALSRDVKEHLERMEKLEKYIHSLQTRLDVYEIKQNVEELRAGDSIPNGEGVFTCKTSSKN